MQAYARRQQRLWPGGGRRLVASSCELCRTSSFIRPYQCWTVFSLDPWARGKAWNRTCRPERITTLAAATIVVSGNSQRHVLPLSSRYRRPFSIELSRRRFLSSTTHCSVYSREALEGAVCC